MFSHMTNHTYDLFHFSTLKTIIGYSIEICTLYVLVDNKHIYVPVLLT